MAEGEAGGAQQSAGHECPALKSLSGANEGGQVFGEAEREVIQQFLAVPGGACASGGRARAMAREALKLAAALLLAYGIEVGFSDGNELDQVGCTVTARPGKASHTHSGKRRDVGDEPGGAAGGSSGQGDGDPGRPECEVRAERCVYRLEGGVCRISRERCRLMRVQGDERRVQNGYVLRRGLGGWRLVFAGRESVLPDEKGVAYVAALLMDPPSEPIHGTELANRAFGDAVMDGQRNLAIDDRETAEAMHDARRKCQAVMDDADANEMEQDEARAELEEINAWARKHLRGTEANEQRQVRAVRQAIRRLLAGLRGSRDPVLLAFGQHVERHLWEPSSRGGGSGRVRAGLAGRFTYEPPEGVRWKA